MTTAGINKTPVPPRPQASPAPPPSAAMQRDRTLRAAERLCDTLTRIAEKFEKQLDKDLQTKGGKQC